MGIKQFVFGFLLALSISSCGTIKFLYKHYVFDYEAQILRGPKASDDLQANVCAYVNNEYQCVVMKTDEFYRLKSTYLKMGQKIDELERTCRN